MTLDWLNDPVKLADQTIAGQAVTRQAQLTKPAGSLGMLENLAIQLSSLQRSGHPSAEKVQITIFAADHGVAAAGVSAFPQEVTVQMIANFSAGGAAISVLARSLNATLEVVDVGTAVEPGELPGVISQRAGPGTANLQVEDAMSSGQLSVALDAGRAAIMRAKERGMELFIGGDMGIGNTTPAAALGCVLLGADPGQLAGPGTGLDSRGVAHKVTILREALTRYDDLMKRPLEALRCLGGFEIAALVGAYISCAQLGIPVLIDGYITTAAALVAVRHQSEIRDWLIFSHQSAEPGHQAMLKALDAMPLLNLGMRLGEGSGAATAVPLLRAACDLHNNMATFADAGVAES
ncbi:MAG: nicotinate-nucleotide--dimethylbenzimidazole phosphoribosyltransferase [Sedimenticola thiotaurini]|uniref:Nicotinate-nucleotide--dimethylbenzimidazole phosphoribosyltransferase n=1 Tax=Sedimenticola thiotaurini TaxID=1543721 RepID=A0A558D529_9GAMM|nr:MAG: nicotinate-nucleotide--dimethylbenzimidazole phosphoribosyltransferase [Sedimenticola thiotaurini]